MLMKNEKGLGIVDSVIAGIVTIVGILIITNVNTAANIQGTTGTLVNLIGLVLAAGGILYILLNVFKV